MRRPPRRLPNDHLPRIAITLLGGLGIIVALACSGGDQQPAQPSPDAPRATAEAAGTPQGADTEPPASATETPDLLPDITTTVPDDIYIEEGSDGEKLLRFSTSVENRGEGPLELLGAEDAATGNVIATQVIAQRDGGEREHFAGHFVMSDGHNHWHLENFALFELFPFEGSQPTSGAIASQNKITFCLIDEARIEPPPEHVAEVPRFLACEWDSQGISEGWRETYAAWLPEQWVVITDVPDGLYVLRTTLDPDGLLLESDTENNAVVLVIEIDGDDVALIEEP